jgi:hypothetical protein
MKGGVKTIIDEDMSLDQDAFSGPNTSKAKEGYHEE